MADIEKVKARLIEILEPFNCETQRRILGAVAVIYGFAVPCYPETLEKIEQAVEQLRP